MRDALGWLLTYWTIARGMGHLVSLALGHLDASSAIADNLPSPVARIRCASLRFAALRFAFVCLAGMRDDGCVMLWDGC